MQTHFSRLVNCNILEIQHPASEKVLIQFLVRNRYKDRCIVTSHSQLPINHYTPLEIASTSLICSFEEGAEIELARLATSSSWCKRNSPADRSTLLPPPPPPGGRGCERLSIDRRQFGIWWRVRLPRNDPPLFCASGNGPFVCVCVWENRRAEITMTADGSYLHRGEWGAGRHSSFFYIATMRTEGNECRSVIGTEHLHFHTGRRRPRRRLDGTWLHYNGRIPTRPKWEATSCEM